MLHLAMNEVITTNRVTSVLIAPAVIKIVHAIVKNEKMPNTVLLDTAWTAGVGFNEEQFDENEEDGL